MSDYTDAAKLYFYSNPSDDVLLETIEITHPLLSETIRLVKNREDLDLTLEDSMTHTFEGVGFNLTLPPAGDNGLQDLSLAIDNTEHKVTDFVNTIKGSKIPAQVKYRPFLLSDLTQPQISFPLVLFLRNVTLTAFDGVGRASFADLINKKFPSENYTRARFPSLGG
jgi:hypothetical protein